MSIWIRLRNWLIVRLARGNSIALNLEFDHMIKLRGDAALACGNITHGAGFSVSSSKS